MGFISRNITTLVRKCVQNSSVQVENPALYNEVFQNIAKLPEPALPGQMLSVVGGLFSIFKYRYVNVIGEPGVGKTNIAAYIASMCSQLLESKISQDIFQDKLASKNLKKFQGYHRDKGIKVLFLSDGSKHYKKMTRTFQRVIGAKTFIVRNFKDIDVFFKDVPAGEIYLYIVSKDSARLGYTKNSLRTCPSCGINPYKEAIADAEERKKPLTRRQKSLLFFDNCPHCNDKLSYPAVKPIVLGGEENFLNKRCAKNEHKGVRRVPLFSEAKRRAKWKKIFDLLVVDEVHNMQGLNTLQSQAFREANCLSSMLVTMTGTSSNGYASSMFNLLYTVNPILMKNLGYGDTGGLLRFIDHYGTRVGVPKSNNASTFGKVSLSVKERPVVSPALYTYLMAPYSTYLSMEALNYPMPAYSENVVIVPEEENKKTFTDIVERFLKRLKQMNLSASGYQAFMQLLLYAEDNIKKDYTFKVTPSKLDIEEYGLEDELVDGRLVLGNTSPIDIVKQYSNKEMALVERIREELSEGRNSMIYTLYNDASGVQDRLVEVLTTMFPDEEITVVPKTVKSENLEHWIEENGSKICICQFYRIATGLDIVKYPTLIFYQFGYDITKIRQARRRAWRAVKQTQECKVFYFAYEGFQAKALSLVSQKIASAGVVDGEVVKSNDIASYTENSIMVELVNQMLNEAEEALDKNYATEHVPAGKLRPWTVWEDLYLQKLEKFNPYALEYIDSERFEKLGLISKKLEIDIELEQSIEEESFTEASTGFSISKLIEANKEEEPKIDYGISHEVKSKKGNVIGVQLSLF